MKNWEIVYADGSSHIVRAFDYAIEGKSVRFFGIADATEAEFFDLANLRVIRDVERDAE